MRIAWLSLCALGLAGSMAWAGESIRVQKGLDDQLAEVRGGGLYVCEPSYASNCTSAVNNACGTLTYRCDTPCGDKFPCTNAACDNSIDTVRVCILSPIPEDCSAYTKNDCGMMQKGECTVTSTSVPESPDCGGAGHTRYDCTAGPCVTKSGLVSCAPKVCGG